jgi:hypothetical protein
MVRHMSRNSGQSAPSAFAWQYSCNRIYSLSLLIMAVYRNKAELSVARNT